MFNVQSKQKPDMKFWGLWNLSFGFFGVQIAYALQSANISRIFATLGADPHSLSYFWILPPLMGILVQPVVGTLSDKTWCRFGRRLFVHRSRYRRTRDVSAAKCRFIRTGIECRNDLWSGLTDVP